MRDLGESVGGKEVLAGRVGCSTVGHLLDLTIELTTNVARDVELEGRSGREERLDGGPVLSSEGHQVGV